MFLEVEVEFVFVFVFAFVYGSLSRTAQQIEAPRAVQYCIVEMI